MNKIILKIGWPGALLLLVAVISIGIYAIVNQSIKEDELTKVEVETKKVISNKNTEDLDEYVNSKNNTSVDKKSSSKITNNIEKKSEDKIIKENIENQEVADLLKNKIIETIEPNDLKKKKQSNFQSSLNDEKNNDKTKKTDIQNESNLSSLNSPKLNNKTEGFIKKEETKVDILRVDESGITVIAGNAEPSTTVEAKIGDKTIAKTEVNKDGDFVITGQITSSNDPQELKIITRVDKKVEETNQDLEKKEEDWVYETRSFLILPGIINHKDSKNGSNEKIDDLTIVKVEKDDFIIQQEYKPISVENLTLDRIKYSENGTAILFGRARKEMNVLIYLNNNFQRKTRPSLDGAWTVDLGFVKPGIYKLRVDETSDSGEVKFRIETPFKQEAKDLLDKIFTEAITVQPGNSLWRIARKIYGRGIMYVEIYNKNSHLIKDPNLIYPGQIFSLLN